MIGEKIGKRRAVAQRRSLELLESRCMLSGQPVPITNQFSSPADFRIEGTLVATELPEQTAFVAKLGDSSEAMLLLDDAGNIEELRAGDSNGLVGSSQVEYDGKLYFSANHGVWVWDATTEQTIKLVDITRGVDARFLQFQDRILFSHRVNNSYRWWVTDGTLEGTRQFSDVVGQSIVEWGEHLYFNDELRRGLYRMSSDFGTPELVFRSEYRSPQSGDVARIEMMTLGNRLLFWEKVIGAPSRLWTGVSSSEGFVAERTSTQVWSRVRDTRVLGDRMIFVGETIEQGEQLWITDGTAEGTRPVDGIRPASNFSNLDAVSVFWADDGELGTELWRTDGTVHGTYLLRDIVPGSESPNRGLPTKHDLGVLRFQTRDESGLSLWTTDGTVEGTVLEQDMLPGRGDERELLLARESIGGKWLVGTNQRTDLAENWWVTSGESSVSIADWIDIELAQISFLTTHQEQWFFAVLVQHFGWEVWRTDGTAEGTMPVRETRAEYSRVLPRYVTSVGEQLVYAYDNRKADRGELWATDGTAEGTRFLGATLSYDSRQLLSAYAKIETSGQVLISLGVDTTPEGIEQWVTDGTPEGTKRATLEETPFNLEVVASSNELVLVSGESRQSGRQLWNYDRETGTAIVVVPDFRRSDQLDLAGNDVFIRRRMEVAGDAVVNLLRYDASDANEVANQATYEAQLIRSSPAITSVVAHEELVYFGAQELGVAADQFAIWSSDGTQEGTQPLATFAHLPTPFIEDEQLMVRVAEDEIWTLSTESNEFVQLTGVPPEPPLEVPGETISQSTEIGTLTDRTVFSIHRFEIGNRSYHGLYITDMEGPVRLAEVVYQSQTEASNYAFDEGVEIEGEFYFSLTHPDFASTRAQHEIWKTDGTPEGTQLVTVAENTDLRSRPRFLGAAPLGAGLLFTQSGDIYKLDTTNQTLEQLLDVPETLGLASWLSDSVYANGQYFVHSYADVPEFYTTDGTKAGTHTIETESRIRQLHATRDSLFVVLGTERDQILELATVDVLVPSDAERADLDLSGVVDFADFLLLSANFGSTNAAMADGDLDGDGEVNFADFLVLSSVFGQSIERDA